MLVIIKRRGYRRLDTWADYLGQRFGPVWLLNEIIPAARVSRSISRVCVCKCDAGSRRRMKRLRSRSYCACAVSCKETICDVIALSGDDFWQILPRTNSDIF